MKAASTPRTADELRILVVDGRGQSRIVSAPDFPTLLEPGDLVVVNDAATLPATLYAKTSRGEPLEIRLLGARAGSDADLPRFTAALLGRGDHRTRTEDREPPPHVAPGEFLRIDDALLARVIRVSSLSSRLVDIDFEPAGVRRAESSSNVAAAAWAALYRLGRPVQYAHVPARLALWDVQNVWAGRPWAVEMPSAGRALSAHTVLALRAKGIGVARVTHAAGISATGDPEIDRRLPLPERFEVPEDTAAAIVETKQRGGRVIAIGTSVVRALESAARVAAPASAEGGDDCRSSRSDQRREPLHAAQGITDLRLGPDVPLRIVDAILTGVHESDTTHFDLLGAFTPAATLTVALERSEREALLGHELGDAWLLWRAKSLGASATVAA